jgi:phosphate transport system substrate-binding protein
VVNTVKAGTGTIGYADHSAIGDVTAAAIQAGSSKDFVSFSQSGATAAFAKAAVATPTSAKGDLSQKLDYTKLTDKSAYPIPLVSYQIICKTFKDPAQSKITKAYIGYIASTIGQKIASVNAGSAPIPDTMLKQIVATLATVK